MLTASLVIILALWLGWVFYLASMSLVENRKELGRAQTAFAYTVIGPAILYDVIVLNWILGSAIFLDLPREWTLTDRLTRLKATTGWRAKLATWVCATLLNPFSSGNWHC